MKKFEMNWMLIVVCAVIAIFGIYSEVFAGIENTTSSSGGGGGSSSGVNPDIEGLTTYQSIDFGGLYLSADKRNNQNEVYISSYGKLEQNWGDKYYFAENQFLQVYKGYELNSIIVGSRFDFFAMEYKPDYALLPEADINSESSLGIEIPGIEFNFASYVRNSYNYIAKEISPEEVEFEAIWTPNLEFGFYFEAQNAFSSNPRFWVNFNDQYEEEIRETLSIDFYTTVYFKESSLFLQNYIDNLPESPEQSIPEPASMVLLGLGGLLIRSTRKK
ncbi:MAG: PEP-CTERM sorting domain-containing protein [Candidatus Nanoarchaeia archaeon]